MVGRGLGCALVKRVNKVNSLLKTIRSHGHPVSIKMRLGMNSYEKERKAYLNLITGTDADFYIVHARHGKETLQGPADFSIYPGLVRTGKDIIANGDIQTIDQIKTLISLGVKGAMIGRAAQRDPAIFRRLKAGL